MTKRTKTLINLDKKELEEVVESAVKKALTNFNQERYLTRAEVCNLLHKSKDTIIRMVKRGDLQEYRPDKGRPRYLYSDVIKLRPNE